MNDFPILFLAISLSYLAVGLLGMGLAIYLSSTIPRTQEFSYFMDREEETGTSRILITGILLIVFLVLAYYSVN